VNEAPVIASFLGRLVVDDLGLEAFALAPAQVHAK